MFRLTLQTLYPFCHMKFYQQIAAFLQVEIPPLNQAIPIQLHQICIVKGIKKQIPQTQDQSPEHNQPLNLPNHIQPSIQQHIKYVVDRGSLETLSFQNALQIAKTLKMDLCLAHHKQPEQPILKMQIVRQQIYKDYFSKHLQNDKPKNKLFEKVVRLSKTITENDLMTKVNNVRRMVNQGTKKLKIMGQDDGQEIRKKLLYFGNKFDKFIDLRLETFKTGKYNKISNERWIGYLTFDEELPLDFQYINKQWRRKLFKEDRLAKDQDKERQQKLTEGIFKDIADFSVERELVRSFLEMNIEVPKRYQQAANLRTKLVTDKYALEKQAIEDAQKKQQMEQKGIFQKVDPEEERLAKIKMDKFNRKFFGERTVEEIVEEMEELKNNNFQSEAYKYKQYKELEAELKEILGRPKPIF